VSQVRVHVTGLVAAFFDTARSRAQAVQFAQRMYRWADGTELSRADATALVEAYYAQAGGEPWLRKDMP